MPYDPLALVVTGTAIASAWGNQVRANQALTPAALATASGQLFRATGAGAIEAFDIGSSGQSLIVSGGLPVWGTPSLPASATIATSLAIGTNPAATGFIRLPNNLNGIYARNNTNTGDVHLVGTSGNAATFGSTVDCIFGSGTMQLTYNGGLQVSTPTGGNKGVGTINVAVDIYRNNVAYTSPAFVFEHAFTGSIEKYAGNEGADEYTGLLSFDDLRAFVREHFDLPLMARHYDGGIFQRGELLMASLEEAYLYIFQLADRIAVLEAK